MEKDNSNFNIGADVDIKSLYPPGDHRLNDKGKNAPALDVILDTMFELRASYPGELMELTGYCRDTINYNLIKLKRAGKIERVYIEKLNIDKIPEFVKKRVPSLWAKGIKGKQITRRAWYIVPDGMVENIRKELDNVFES